MFLFVTLLPFLSLFFPAVVGSFDVRAAPGDLRLLQLGLDQGDLFSNPLQQYGMALCITLTCISGAAQARNSAGPIVLSVDRPSVAGGCGSACRF